MPRAFLVRNYTKKTSYEHFQQKIQELLDASKIICSDGQQENNNAVYSSSSNQQSTWNYEMEKNYWFDLEDNKPNKREKIFIATNNNNKCNKEPKSKSKTKAKISAAATTMLNDFEVASKLEIDSKQTINTAQPQSANGDTLAWENLDTKLQQMLEEDPDLVTKNIKQFLQNNRIIMSEIAIETGLEEETISSFMDHKAELKGEQKQEFYRWYLTKILRPPNGADDESFTCYKCGKIFAYESYLERHIKYVCPDNTGRTWKCSYCGKAFQYPCYLRRHIRSHTGESPYKCDKCDRAFVRSTDLQRHIRNHTGEKPYRCSECNRAFARSTDLKRHMRTHTGEKPYKCWQCGKTFSQSGSLQTHLHTHKKDGSSTKRAISRQGK